MIIPKEIPSFKHVATSNDGSTHNIGISTDGQAYTWGKTNSLGQLGRPTDKSSTCTGRGHRKNTPQHAIFSNPQVSTLTNPLNLNPAEKFIGNVKSVRGFVGGFKDSGHSAILDEDGFLWLSGCDRWQQLGLGSSTGRAAGYTWKNGALWQETFQRNDYLRELMKNFARGNQNTERIRDVALGGDHTVVLSEDRCNVFTFGKGREGQLGLKGEKPFVSSPVHAKGLSSVKGDIAAVCAIRHCSVTLDENGNILKHAGKCNQFNSELMKEFIKGCRDRAQEDRLVKICFPKEVGTQ